MTHHGHRYALVVALLCSAAVLLDFSFTDGQVARMQPGEARLGGVTQDRAASRVPASAGSARRDGDPAGDLKEQR